ncbi:MAG: AI-2E family transporter [Dokdonella sp.]
MMPTPDDSPQAADARIADPVQNDSVERARLVPVASQSDASSPAAEVAVEDAVEDTPISEATPTPPPQNDHDDRRDLTKSMHRLVSVLAIATVIYSAYFARELLLPILLAAFFAVLLSPIMKKLTRGWVPRWIGALLLVALSIGVVVGIGNALYAPASEWAGRAPKVMRDAKPKLKALIHPLLQASKMSESLDEITGDDKMKNPAVVVQAAPSASLLSTTPKLVASLLAVVLLTYFFLVYGDTLLRKALQLSPTWSQKRLTVDIVRSIQSDVSRYVMTISATSAVLGIVVTGFLWSLGVESPWLWGAVAALLNLAPYVGPVLMTGLLCMVGLAQFPSLGAAVLPAAGYLGLHLMESQVVTPLALGKTINLNPLAIILWLMIWGWLWGIVGLLIAVPMLVTFKIFCSRTEGMESWAILLEK